MEISGGFPTTDSLFCPQRIGQKTKTVVTISRFSGGKPTTKTRFGHHCSNLHFLIVHKTGDTSLHYISVAIRNAKSTKQIHMIAETSLILPVKTFSSTQLSIPNMIPFAME